MSSSSDREPDEPLSETVPLSDIVLELLSAYRRPHGGSSGDSENAIRSVQILEARYERTKNPIYAWKAYMECRANQLRLPSWVVGYLDHVATKIYQLMQNPPKGGNVDREIRRAVGLEATGRKNPFQEDWNYTDRLSLALHIKWYVDKDLDDTHAQSLAARDRGVSESTARRAWEEFEELITLHLAPRFQKQ